MNGGNYLIHATFNSAYINTLVADCYPTFSIILHKLITVLHVQTEEVLRSQRADLRSGQPVAYLGSGV